LKSPPPGRALSSKRVTHQEEVRTLKRQRCPLFQNLGNTPSLIRHPKHKTHGGLTRETAYLYDDEDGALEERAKKERCSKSEVIRRALRRYLGLEGRLSAPPD
jgi:hypothetical protein